MFFFAVLALIVAALSTWVSWYRRKTLREIADWEELRRSL